MIGYIVPVDAKKINVNQYMFGFHSIYNSIHFDWRESYDFEDFKSYFQSLPDNQRFLVFKTKEQALLHTQSNESVAPGNLVNIRSRLPVYTAELDVESASISKTNIKKLLACTLETYISECNFAKQEQNKAEFAANIIKLTRFSESTSLKPNVKKSIKDVIDCIQQPTYKSLGFEEKKSITEKTILFIEGKLAASEYESFIQKRYLGEKSSVELKILGGVLMVLAVAFTAFLLTMGASVIGPVLVGAGLGLIGHTLFSWGQGSGVSKPLHEIFDASTEFANIVL